jgi:hypothetical protein
MKRGMVRDVIINASCGWPLSLVLLYCGKRRRRRRRGKRVGRNVNGCLLSL